MTGPGSHSWLLAARDRDWPHALALVCQPTLQDFRFYFPAFDLLLKPHSPYPSAPCLT